MKSKPEAPKLVGYTTGVFDLFHIGHLNILKSAKKECDKLIVGLTTDELCFKLKGKRPVVPYSERKQILEAIVYVDAVVAQDKIDEVADWRTLKFNTIFKGSDWKNTAKWNELEKKFKDLQVRVHYFPYTDSTSSSLIRQTLLQFNQSDSSLV